MSETVNIGKMAEFLSSKLFEVFGWVPFGAENENWRCNDPEHAVGNRTEPTHPADVCLSYDDPYDARRVYFIVDLKSYASTSISAASVRTSFINLSKAVACANADTAWSDLYLRGDETAWRVDGLLFVYNHDAKFAGNFGQYLQDIDEEHFKINPPDSRIVVLGPADVDYLATVSTDIRLMRGDGQLPERRFCSFWHPNPLTRHLQPGAGKAASIEMLTGPWQIVKATLVGSKPNEDSKPYDKFVIWMRENGSSVDQFKYMFDMMFRYQMLNDESTKIQVRIQNPAEKAFVNFKRAKEDFSASVLGFASETLAQIDLSSVQTMVPHFAVKEIGMYRDAK